MQRFKNVRLATQGISAVLLCCAAFIADAEQMMRSLPAPSAAQPVPAPTSIQPVAGPSAVQPIAVPAAAQPAVIAPLPQMKLAPPVPSGGMAQLNPAVACISNNTPRITNINGTQFGIVFQPGSQLNIAGCGFGKGGQVYLSGGGTTTVQLKIDSWSDSNIHAHIDASLGGVPDFDGVKVNIKPNGLSVISSIETNKFRAARVQFVMAIPPEVAGTYSQIYGSPTTINTGSYYQIGETPSGKTSSTGSVSASQKMKAAPTATMSVFTRVSRAHLYPMGFCPPVSDQPSQMTDSWPVNFLADGFEVIDVKYTDETDQKNGDNENVQWVLVGNSGSPKYDAMQKRVSVTFQGNSMYVKKMGAMDTIGNAAFNPVALYKGLTQSGSACTSSYTVSLTVSGPRGMSPFK